MGLWCLILLLSSCSKRPAQPGGGRTGPPRPVTTTRAAIQVMERTVLATGSLLAQEQSTLSVKVPGRLTVVAVDLGSAVRQGDLIAQIEPRDYELRVQQAAAALSQARATLGLPLEGEDDRIAPEDTSPVRQAKAVLEEAVANRDRVLSLSQQGISSAAERDTVQAAYKVALNRYETALDDARTRQASLAQRRAELELARKQLADTAVRAPFDGVVQTRIANLGGLRCRRRFDAVVDDLHPFARQPPLLDQHLPDLARDRDGRGQVASSQALEKASETTLAVLAGPAGLEVEAVLGVNDRESTSEASCREALDECSPVV